jgi:hypothetical protein
VRVRALCLPWEMQKEMKRIEELKYLKDVPRLAKETTDWPELVKCIDRAKVSDGPTPSIAAPNSP